MKIALSKNPVLAMLENYGIHPECGFLPSPDPLERLPEEFEAWETMAQGLPKFLI
jgi:indoleamine 2,3-dioxygenase